MASTRQAQLANQKKLGDTRRVLAPRDTSVSSIAKKSFTNELSIMVQQYNDGKISNDEMRTFFTTALKNPYVSDNPTETANIQSQLDDFEQRIIGDRLQARYKSTVDGSADRVLAAQQLASYYKQRASTMQPDTPAYSQAMENAGSWQNQVLSDTKAIEKRARQIKRAQMEEQIATIPANTSENIAQQSAMFSQLANDAFADGDQLEASRLQAQAQQAQTRSQVVAENEAKQQEAEFNRATKKDIVDTMNMLANDYHDGKIDESQYLGALGMIEPKITEFGDTALALSFNRVTDQVQKNLEKGGLRRGVTENGLPVVLGKNKNGADVTDWDQNDAEYKAVTKDLESKLAKGEIDTNTYAAQMASVLVERYNDVQNRIASLDGKSEFDRVMYQGKRQTVANLRTMLSTEYDSASGWGRGDKTEDGGLQQRISDFQSGNVAVVMVPPDEVSGNGVKRSGRAIAKLEFVNLDNLPKDQYVADETGVYHKIEREKVSLTPDQAMQAAAQGNMLVIDGQMKQVKFDSSGNAYYESNNQVARVYKPGTSEHTLMSVGDQPLQTYDSFMKAQAQLQQQVDQPAAPQQPKPPGIVDKAIDVAKRVVSPPVQSPMQPTTTDKVVSTLQKSPIQAVSDVVGPKVQPVVAPVQKAVEPVVKAVEPVMQAAKPVVQSAIPPLNLATQVQNALPTIAKNVQPAVQAVQQAAAPVLNQVPQQVKSAVQQSPFDFAKQQLEKNKSTSFLAQSPFQFLSSLFKK